MNFKGFDLPGICQDLSVRRRRPGIRKVKKCAVRPIEGRAVMRERASLTSLTSSAIGEGVRGGEGERGERVRG